MTVLICLASSIVKPKLLSLTNAIKLQGAKDSSIEGMEEEENEWNLHKLYFLKTKPQINFVSEKILEKQSTGQDEISFTSLLKEEPSFTLKF